VGPWKISDALTGPLGRAASAALWSASQLACRQRDRAGEEREKGEDDGTDVQKIKIAGAWVKKG
jgi:hypothetical protein